MAGSVLLPWVEALPLMQQGVLLAAIRGPDGIYKDHPAKRLQRWYRRCVLRCAFTGAPFKDAFEPGGGSFTGPCDVPLDSVATFYRQALDELPHHYQGHVLHAAEVLGYKHPDVKTRAWWHWFYRLLVKDLHLNPETADQMDYRLGDDESHWRASDAAVAVRA
jgi:hypothetical protein